VAATLLVGNGHVSQCTLGAKFLLGGRIAEMKGTLGEGILPGLLRDLYVGRRTGYLLFARQNENRSVYFRRGHILNARTDVKEDWLGEVLVRHGYLSAVDLERATTLVQMERIRLGQALYDLGLFDKETLEDALALHVREVLFKVFSWGDGSYMFEERDEMAALDEEITLKLSTGEIILEAVRRVQDPDVVRYALGDIDRVLAPSTDPLLRFQKVTLSPADGYILSRVDGVLTAREVIQVIPLDPVETQRSLFGLLCTGIVEFLTQVRRPVAPPPTHPLPPRVAERVAAPPPPPPPAAMPPPPAEAEENAERESRRQEIVDAFDGLKQRTHFDVLGLERSANDTQVKEAYFRLAKRFHPDVQHDPHLADLRDKLEAVFIRLGEAYEVLRSSASRSRYDSSLPRVRPAAPPPAEEPPPRVLDPETEERLATDNLRRGEKLLADARYWDAIQLFESALPKLKPKLALRARLGIARAQLKNPKWLKRGEEMLLSIVHDEPLNLEAHFELAQLYRSRGLRNRALSHFRKVLEHRPDHEESLRAEAELAFTEPEPEPEQGGGLLKKLFGKK
jgi:tetratricopeptide (TPR) repeat protein